MFRIPFPLQEQPFDWRRYGGPLTVLRLSEFVRGEILKDQEPPSPMRPLPQKTCFQQGDLILMKVNEIPPDAVGVEAERLPDGGLPLGDRHVLYPAARILGSLFKFFGNGGSLKVRAFRSIVCFPARQC
jgi:hypothetical protein